MGKEIKKKEHIYRRDDVEVTRVTTVDRTEIKDEEECANAPKSRIESRNSESFS